jgi:hypothetical protein
VASERLHHLVPEIMAIGLWMENLNHRFLALWPEVLR